MTPEKVEAQEYLSVFIEQDHIDTGVPGDCTKCAGALAIKETLERIGMIKPGDGWNVSVAAFVTVYKGHEGNPHEVMHVWNIGDELEEFVNRYDNDYDPEPCEVFIDMEDQKWPS